MFLIQVLLYIMDGKAKLGKNETRIWQKSLCLTESVLVRNCIKY